MIKLTAVRTVANADLAARKLVEIANDVEAVQDGRIYIEQVNAPFLKAGGKESRSSAPSPERNDSDGRVPTKRFCCRREKKRKQWHAKIPRGERRHSGQ